MKKFTVLICLFFLGCADFGFDSLNFSSSLSIDMDTGNSAGFFGGLPAMSVNIGNPVSFSVTISGASQVVLESTDVILASNNGAFFSCMINIVNGTTLTQP